MQIVEQQLTHNYITMKSRFIYILTLLLCGVNLYAQENAFFVPNPGTAKWAYEKTDAKGKHISDEYYSVESISGDTVNGSVKLKVKEVMAKAPLDTVTTMVFYRFRNGEFLVDMNAFFEDDILSSLVTEAADSAKTEITEAQKKEAIEELKKHIKVSGDIRGIPQYPQVGNLPDFDCQMKFTFISMKVAGEQRKITGKETIQTPAGTFDCFIMEETITTKVMIHKETERNVSWYAYGIGMVKEATYDKKGKLLSVTTLKWKNW